MDYLKQLWLEVEGLETLDREERGLGVPALDLEVVLVLDEAAVKNLLKQTLVGDGQRFVVVVSTCKLRRTSKVVRTFQPTKVDYQATNCQTFHRSFANLEANQQESRSFCRLCDQLYNAASFVPT